MMRMTARAAPPCVERIVLWRGTVVDVASLAAPPEDVAERLLRGEVVEQQEGALTLILRSRPRAPAVVDRGAPVDDRRFATLLTIVGLCCCGVVSTLLSAPPPARDDPAMMRTSPVTKFVMAAPPQKPKPVPKVKAPPVPRASAAAASRVAAAQRDPAARKEAAAREVASVLRALHLHAGGALGGGEIEAALAQLDGPRSSGPGPENTGARTIGGGRALDIGKIGGDRGREPCCGDGAGPGELIGKRPSHVVVDTKSPDVGKGLSKAEVRRVLDRAMSRFRYCYEKELSSHPDLQSKLALAFTIGGDGHVAAATVADDAASRELSSCVTRVVKSLAFPRPDGGAAVSVTYPFLFSTSGSTSGSGGS